MSRRALNSTSFGDRPFEVGTACVFFQAAAPRGWTQDTDNDDKALRVVDDTGGGTGGTDVLSTPPSTSHVHAGAIHTHSGFTNGDGAQVLRTAGFEGTSFTGHQHTFTTDAGGAGSTGISDDIAFKPAYIDVIVATKDK